MKNLKMKKIAIVLFAILIMLTISTKVFATSDELVNPIQIYTDKPDTSTQQNVQEEQPTNVAPTTEANTATTNTTTTETKLPQTGDASDYAIFLLVAVSIIVSIYAYKKVRDYNNI